MEREQQLKKYSFIKRCAEFRHDLRFQVWDSKVKNLQHRTFKEFHDKKITSILFYCDQILRYSIETPTYSEYRIDIDKPIEECISIAKGMNEKLSKFNIKTSWYSSGGKGLHGHFLFTLKDINLKQNNLNINIQELNKEFRFSDEYKKNLSTPNLDLVELKNVERSQIRKLMSEFIGINENNDPQLYSSQIMFGLEGGTHRKTNLRKILININNPTDEILKYIKQNNTKFIINENYFNEINKLPKECIDFINIKLESVTNKPLKEKKMYKVSNESKRLHTKENSDSQGIIYRYYTLALIQLYKEREIKSQHNYIYYLLRLFNDLGIEKEKTLREVELIINNLNLSNEDNLEKQYNYAIKKDSHVYHGFKQGDGGEKKGSYTEVDLHSLVNKLKLNIPEDVLI